MGHRSVGSVFHRQLGLRVGSGAKSAVFQVTSPGDLEPPSPSHPHVHAHGTFHWHWAPLDAPCRLSTVPERRQKGSNRGFGRKWAIVHRIINGELMSDTIFFRFLNPGLWWAFTPSLEAPTPQRPQKVSLGGVLCDGRIWANRPSVQHSRIECMCVVHVAVVHARAPCTAHSIRSC